jgi:hypothetical protein
MRDGRPKKSNASARGKLARFTYSGAWTALSLGFSTLIGFALLAELRVGPIVAGIVGLGAYALLAYGVPYRLGRTTRGEDIVTISDPPYEDARVELLVEAHQHIAVLSGAKQNLPLALGDPLNQLHARATSILEEVTANPEKLNSVLRFFTYYLPSTADLAMDRVKLAAHAGNERLNEIDQTLFRLVDAFKGFEQVVLTEDLQSVDLDIELLEEAINADFEGLKK